MALLYFCNVEPKIIKDLNIRLPDFKALNDEFKETLIRSSNLQEKITTLIKKVLTTSTGILVEHDINGLPVDIYCSMGIQRYVMQINGPTHYIFISDTEYQSTPKDRFHEKIIQCNLPPVSNQSASSMIKVIRIDYGRFEKEGNRYIVEELKRNGLEVDLTPTYNSLFFRNRTVKPLKKEPLPTLPLPKLGLN